MRVVGMLFVAWVAATLVPGIGELMEDALHVALDAHASDHAEGEAPCPEHGCTPTAHHCSCCVSLSIVATPTEALVPETRARTERYDWPLPASARPGFTRSVLRPPTA